MLSVKSKGTARSLMEWSDLQPPGLDYPTLEAFSQWAAAHTDANHPFIPVRNRIPAAWSPTGSNTWFRGFVVMQNFDMSMKSGDVASIIGSIGNDWYGGHISKSGSGYACNWKKLS